MRLYISTIWMLLWIICLSPTLLFYSCKKFVTVSAPITSTNSGNVFSADGSAIAAVTGIYAQMSSQNLSALQGLPSLSLIGGLSADEFSLYTTNNIQLSEYYFNNLSSSTAGSEIWNDVYAMLYQINLAITGLSNNSTITPAVDQQLLGEVKFMRALCYFYLVNLYGDVPLVLSTDYSENEKLAKSPAASIYQQVIGDLHDSEGLLSENYFDGSLLNQTPERTRPTKWAAAALLARAYLFAKNYDGADSAASAVINNSSLYGLVNDVSQVFLKNSNEAIWQLQPVNTAQNTEDAITFILPATGPSSGSPVHLSRLLLNAFEPGDLRRTGWIDSISVGDSTYYYPFKYKINTLNATPGAPAQEYESVFRLSEMFLIRAEGEANGTSQNLTSAVQDLNVVRGRAGLLPYKGFHDAVSVTTAIMQERRVELFSEWGHRWLDLKRSGTIDNVMTNACVLKGGTWNSYQQLYPLPLTDLLLDKNLVQNNGYN